MLSWGQRQDGPQQNETVFIGKTPFLSPALKFRLGTTRGIWYTTLTHCVLYSYELTKAERVKTKTNQPTSKKSRCCDNKVRQICFSSEKKCKHFNLPPAVTSFETLSRFPHPSRGANTLLPCSRFEDEMRIAVLLSVRNNVCGSRKNTGLNQGFLDFRGSPKSGVGAEDLHF